MTNHNAVVLLGLLSTVLLNVQGFESGDESTVPLFKRMDTNQDNVLSKKEFYYALMEEEFETLASKYAVPTLELEFEVQDLDHDRKISLQEWKTIFTPSQTDPLTSDFVKQEIEKSEQAARAQREKEKTAAMPPPPPPPPPAPPVPASNNQRGSGITTPPVPNKMHVGAELVMPDNRKFYLADDATWLEVEEFCKVRGIRLCRYEELCPAIVDHVSKEDKDERWVPVEGPAHKWMELSNCGMTIWPDYIKHRGLVACCDDKPEPPPPTLQPGAADTAAASGGGNSSSNAESQTSVPAEPAKAKNDEL